MINCNLKIAVLGIHDAFIAEWYKTVLETMEYRVLIAETLDAMIETLNLEHLLDTNVHSDVTYIMDVNLGYPNRPLIWPGKIIYDLVKASLDRGASKYMSITGNDSAVRQANKIGLPCTNKAFFELISFLKK